MDWAWIEVDTIKAVCKHTSAAAVVVIAFGAFGYVLHNMEQTPAIQIIYWIDQGAFVAAFFMLARNLVVTIWNDRVRWKACLAF